VTPNFQDYLGGETTPTGPLSFLSLSMQALLVVLQHFINRTIFEIKASILRKEPDMG
jgi:hypothetical protein